jgi:hypothetical protein
MIAEHKERCQMKNGDLSNKAAPRIYVVFEGLIASVPEDRKVIYAELTSKRHIDWVKAMKLYELNELVCQKIGWLAFHRDVNICVVSWLHPDASYGIDYLLDKRGLPTGIMMSTPDEMAHHLITRPDVIGIYDPEVMHILTFGSKAKHATGPNDIGGF